MLIDYRWMDLHKFRMIEAKNDTDDEKYICHINLIQIQNIDLIMKIILIMIITVMINNNHYKTKVLKVIEQW